MKKIFTSCSCCKSASLKIGLFLILSFFMAGFYVNVLAGDLNISAGNYGRYYLFHDTKADSVANRFQFDLNMDNFYAGIWYEVKHTETANQPMDSITQRYFGWEDNGLSIHAGTFYQVFDRGLILNTYRDENVQVDIPLEGIRVSGKYKYLDFDVLSGSHKISFNQKPIVRGVHGKLKPVEFFQLGGGYVRLLESDGFNNLRSNYDEVNARINYKLIDWYVEYARRDGDSLYFGVDSTEVIDRDGDGTYTNLSLNYWKLGGFIEYKNYKRLVDNRSISGLRINQPPAVNHQERSILSQYNVDGEEGWRAGLHFSPTLYWFGVIDYAEAQSKDFSRPKYTMSDFYADIHGTYYKDNQFIISFDRLKHSEQNELTPKVELNYTLDDQNSFILDASLIRYIIYEQRDIYDDSLDYTEKYFSLEYDRSQRYSLTIGGSWSDKIRISEPGVKSDPDEMLYIEAMLRYPNHDLTLFYGGQRGGFVCSGGVCTLRPTFRGFRATLLSRF